MDVVVSIDQARVFGLVPSNLTNNTNTRTSEMLRVKLKAGKEITASKYRTAQAAYANSSLKGHLSGRAAVRRGTYDSAKYRGSHT